MMAPPLPRNRLGPLATAALLAIAPASRAAEPPKVERAVSTALEAADMEGCFRWAEVELDGRRPPEVLALLADPAWCGTGGCTLAVFQWVNGRLREVSTIPLVDEVRVSPATTHGWRDLHVTDREGTWRLRFDGTAYPENPTVAPAERSPAPKGAERPRWRSAAGCSGSLTRP